MKEKQESPRRRCLLILIEKIPNAMKLTFLFLVISLLSFTATASAQRVSIVLDNAKVEKVLATITHQTGLSVAYSKQIVDLNRRVSVNFTNAELTNVLDKITEGTSLSYEVKNGKIYLFEKPIANAVTQQAKKITGVVVDSKGEPIIGANVVEKGTTNGTITDFDGKFILEVSDNATLQFSYANNCRYCGTDFIECTFKGGYTGFGRGCGCWLWNPEEGEFDRFCFFSQI